MEVKDAVLGALAMAGVGALATGAFQPISEVVYGVSDKLVNAYVPKSLRKPLPNSNKSILPMKFDITNTPKYRAQFDRDKDRESWDLTKKDLDKLSLNEILNYDKDLLDKKYHSRFEKYKNQRRSNDIFNDMSKVNEVIKIDTPIANGLNGGDHPEYNSNISKDIHENSIIVDPRFDKKRKLKKGLIIGGTGTALTGIAALGIHNLLKNNKSRTIVIPPFEVDRLKLKSMNMSTDLNIVNEMGLDQPVDLARQSVDHRLSPESNPEEAKAEKKRKLKKGLKIAGGIALGTGALGAAALGATIGTPVFLLSRLTKNL